MEQYLHLLIDILYHGTGTIVQLFKNPCTRDDSDIGQQEGEEDSGFDTEKVVALDQE
jgi:hypothetical protein